MLKLLFWVQDPPILLKSLIGKELLFGVERGSLSTILDCQGFFNVIEICHNKEILWMHHFNK